MISRAEPQDSDESEDSTDDEEPLGSVLGGPAAKKRRRRLALPPAALLLGGPPPAAGGVGPTAVDAGGRTRRVPHVEGNFATQAYLEVPETAMWRRQAEVCAEALRRLVGSNGTGALEKVHVTANKGIGWHVSLGPTLYLRHQFIGPLVEALGRTAAASSSRGGHRLLFEEEIWVLASKDRSCYFAAVAVAGATTAWLRPLAAGVLRAATELGVLSDAPDTASMRLHCSLAWTTQDLRGPLEALGVPLHETTWGLAWQLPESVASAHDALQAPATALQVRVGERQHSLPLFAPRSARGAPPALCEYSDDDEE